MQQCAVHWHVHTCATLLQILSASHRLQLDSAIVLKHKGRIKTVIEGTIFQISEWCLPVGTCKCWSYCNALATLQHWPTFFFTNNMYSDKLPTRKKKGDQAQNLRWKENGKILQLAIIGSGFQAYCSRFCLQKANNARKLTKSAQ